MPDGDGSEEAGLEKTSGAWIAHAPGDCPGCQKRMFVPGWLFVRRVLRGSHLCVLGGNRRSCWLFRQFLIRSVLYWAPPLSSGDDRNQKCELACFLFEIRMDVGAIRTTTHSGVRRITQYPPLRDGRERVANARGNFPDGDAGSRKMRMSVRRVGAEAGSEVSTLV